MGSVISNIFEEFKNVRTSVEISLDSIKNELAPYENAIVLYGAGSAGIAFFHYLVDKEIYPVYFSDGDVDKHGKQCEGIEIIPPQDIVHRLGGNCLVIVTINTDGEHYCKDFKKELLKGGHQGVHRRLKECGCNNIIDYTYFRRCYALFAGGKYNLPACSDVEIMVENYNLVEEAYESIDDKDSREVYADILKFRLISDAIDIPTYSEKNMYFEYDLFPYTGKECFVDCGACGGSSLDGFLLSNKEFGAYYGIEPDGVNYKKLKEKIADYHERIRNRIKIINAAAYSSDDSEHFFVLNGPGTFQSDNGPDIVKTIRIDSFLEGRSASYIKMNIEGSEIAALEGAEETIKRYKPRLAIMGYHKTSDLWEVPLCIKKYRPDYKLSLRSYMKNVAFAYYAY